MSRTLVLGLSGQLGDALRPLLRERGEPVLALSRHPPPDSSGIEWLRGSLDELAALPPGIDCILSLGPLDALAAWTERAQPALGRIVAIGSTGRRDKADSEDASERDEARRLARAEDSLLEFGRRESVAVTVLRPTMLYGSGRDSLSRLAGVARRWRVLPLPANATGLRQPVHVADVARAVLDARDAPAAFGRAFDLPGAEALALDTIVRRTLARQAPGTRLLRLPLWTVRVGLRLAAALGRGRGAAWLPRLARDQVADPSEAGLAFGYSPRAFEP